MTTDIVIKKNSIKGWLLAARPKTLVTAVAPIVAATGLAYFNHYPIRWDLSVFALIASLFIQIATNLINDSQDSENQKDTSKRLGPLRMTQLGILHGRQVYWAGIACFVLAVLFGIPLIVQGGYPIFIALLASILAGYIYTAGPYPLAYYGYGDLFVMIFFGWVITDSIYFIQTGTVDSSALLLGAQMGLLATNLFAMTSFRDIEEDMQTGKKTLSVRFGATFARLEITLAVVLPYLFNLYWLILGHPWIAFLPFLTLPLALIYLKNVWVHAPSKLYIKFIGIASMMQLSFGLLLMLGFTI